jgi:CheY-like chemotaxis protein/TolA-binding protein
MRQIDIIKLYAAKRCLVIDDYPEMRGFIRQAVMVFGADSVDTAANGDEAIKQCLANDYDIIFADYNLGDASKNGQQVLEELRYKNALKNTSLYIMITAEATRDMVFSALEYQPDGYITKPFTQNALRSRLDRIMLEKEAIREINQAIDHELFEKGIQLCVQQLEEGSKYTTLLNRKLAGLYVTTGNYREACTLYRKVTQERPIEWATIGLGKVMLLMGELEPAEAIFRKLISVGCNCMEVYDCLAEILQKKQKNLEAQEMLEQALAISPHAILRQKFYAEISETCGDLEKASKAHRSIVKLSPNSCYEEPENYFGYARSLSALMENSDQHDKKILIEAQTILKKVERRYPNNPEVTLQTKLVESQVYASSEQPEKAKQIVENAKLLYKKMDNDPENETRPEVMLEMAKSLLAMDENDEAQDILRKIASRSGTDGNIEKQLDKLSDEPLTKQGKLNAINLNKEGKKLFDSKKYTEAADFFSRGLVLFPNNIALNINMVFALVKGAGQGDMESNDTNRCKASLKKISHISKEHRLYSHYKKLENRIARL